MPRTVSSRSGTRARTAVKRTKTYVGCWTCRSRGVKCDATRPACNRCTRLNRPCEGYTIRLLWDNCADVGDHAQEDAQPKRRLMFVDADMQNPVFKETYLNAVLKQLDSAQLDTRLELVEGPYSVFASALRDRDSGTRLQIDSTSPFETDTVPIQDQCPASIEDVFGPAACYSTSQDLLLRYLPPFLSVSSAEERQLLRFWVTSASGLMVSINHPDNPFRDVVIPLVLESAASTHKLPGHSALLHSVYAFAAFNRSHCQKSPHDQDTVLAAKHHQVGLQYLRQSMENTHGQHEAILASIILMTSIDIVEARSGQWRIHLRGGREWLNSLGGTWNKSKGGLILRQLSSSAFFDSGWEMDIMSSAPLHSPTNDYCLDKFYGITKPVLRAIFDIGRLSTAQNRPTSEEIMALRNTLLLANPSTTRLPSPTAALEKITRHHACSWYYACMIHFERSLQRSPSREIQYLVEQCLYHLEAVETLLQNSVEEGLMWPLFITACEAEDEELRRRCVQIFTKKAKKGVGATPCVEGLVLEIWHRRDMNPEDDTLQQRVTEDMGIDLLLT
ncbi:hypothetical protein EK21DRAFT_72440 [Setomelanomma holmii]|uniref:Zn(2)-C6 fungal-type domain-containing protein n=1 Tax=Setomelanomma holmii TaxID=210430 RepID=A0A9P4H415_9PLEO|nr:hypothetical protein EK21DRAFT_72440 [Setomelanomma holmii]